jgi:tripartite-type tricarboxylate transporter receptor subunit TctC
MPTLIKQAPGVLVGVALACSACAQTWPAKPIRYIVPFPPGGPTDTFSRALTAPVPPVRAAPLLA